MNTLRLSFSFAIACSLTCFGCGSSDASIPGFNGVPACPTALSRGPGSNSQFSVFDGQALSGDYSGPDGSGMFSSACIEDPLGGVQRALAVVLLGARPAVGVTYDLAAQTGDYGWIQYGEGPHGTKVWASTSGTVRIDSVAKDSIGLSFSQAILEPDTSKDGNTASGILTITGSQRADDVLGFVP